MPLGRIWKLDSAWQRNRPNLRPLSWQDGQDPARHQSTHHEAMMALRASRTSAAARRCWGSRTSSFRMRHTVLSETRPSLMGEGEKGRLRSGGLAWVSDPGLQTSWCCLCPMSLHPLPSDPDSLRDGVLGGLDLPEELLGDAVVEGELAVKHGEQHHAQCPHVTRLAPVRPAYGHTDAPLSTNPGKRQPWPPSAYQLPAEVYPGTPLPYHPHFWSPCPPSSQSKLLPSPPPSLPPLQADLAPALETQLGRAIPHRGHASCHFLKAPAGLPALGPAPSRAAHRAGGQCACGTKLCGSGQVSHTHHGSLRALSTTCKDPFLCLFPRLPMGRHVFTCRGLCFASRRALHPARALTGEGNDCPAGSTLGANTGRNTSISLSL